MSEYHPNRTKPVKTRLGLTKRRLLETWPVLIWVGIMALGVIAYRSGVVFNRMNGAVDVEHQYVSSAEDGRLVKVLVKEGDVLAPNSVVAEMDDRSLKHQLQALMEGIAANRREEKLQLERTRLSLQSELRKYEIIMAEDKGKIGTLNKTVGGTSGLTTPSGRTLSSERPSKTESMNVDIAEATARGIELSKSIESVKEDIARVNGLIDNSEKAISAAAAAATGQITQEVLAGLTTSERADLVELQTLLEGCKLRAPKGGVVEKVDKLEGAFVVAGESVVQVVADPGRIVAFLPQEQLGTIKAGAKVWVTPAHSRTEVFESHVISVGARVTSVLDTTSPMKNSRVYGRHLTIAFPKEARGVEGQDAAMLLPGETVIIHTRPPGELPFIDRLFHSDAPDT